MDNTQITTAQAIAHLVGGDGQRWTGPHGHGLEFLAEDHGGTWLRGSDKHHTRIEFADGSAIVTSPGAWDLGFCLPATCTCWPSANGGDHAEDCGGPQ